MALEYTAIPLNESGKRPPPSRLREHAKASLVIASAIVVILGPFVFGFAVGRSQMVNGEMSSMPKFVPEVPLKRVMFQFPTKYEDTGPMGDGLWDGLMPVGAGFVRVPHPRGYGLPPSEPIVNDTEKGEMYSLSAMHQLHCLAVLRDVMIKYEKGDKSRFAGDGHEYHCLDYIRQAIMCAGDTTLDYADDRVIGQDGQVTRYGFTGSNSTHQCRDWDFIKNFAEKHKSGDRIGIL